MMRKMTLCLLAMLCTAVSAMAQATPPADATIETWQATYAMSSSYGNDEGTEAMQVAFKGDDVYFNLPNPLKGNTWVKGTLNGDKAVFAKGQTIGSYAGVTYCLAGSTGTDITDVVFDYNAEDGVFSLSDMFLLLNSGTTTVSYATYYTVFTVMRQTQQPDPEQQEGQTPPTGADIETWNISYSFTSGGETETDTESMQVCFAGSSVYFNFPNPIKGNTWMRGTLSGQTVTFAKGQEVGSYGGTTVYYMGLGEGDVLCDIVFHYDSANRIFTLGDNWLLLNGSLTKVSVLGYFTAATITKGNGEEIKPDVVTPPEGLRTSEYSMTAANIFFDQEGWVTKNVRYNVRLGTSGNNVYVQGLCHSLPQTWIKGKRNASDGELTFPSGQYYGSYKTPVGMTYDFYFAAANYPTTNPTWADEASFSYDAQNVVYTSHDLIALNSSATEMNPYEFLAGVKLTKIYDRAATPLAPVLTQLQPYSEEAQYGCLQINIPVESTTGEGLLTDKLGYQIYAERDGQQSLYTFKTTLYKYLTEEMTLVPYNFSDGYDFYLGGSAIYFYDDLKDATRIGVQSVYTGGGERHESEITWIDMPQAPAGIATVATATGTATYTDLAGRPVNRNYKGLVLKTVRLADGTVKTTKTVRK